MILKSITPRNIGPFVGGSTLQIDPEVTVLTGPNDVGKSFVLRVIELLCTENIGMESERNQDRIGDFSGSWKDDPEFITEALFQVSTTSETGHFTRIQMGEGHEFLLRTRLNQSGHNYEIIHIKQGNKKEKGKPIKIQKWPTVLTLPIESEIRETIDLGKMSEAESEFIRLGFGVEFSLDQHKSTQQVNRTFRVRGAEAKLNAKLKQIMPVTTPLEFMLSEIAGEPELLGIGVVDQHRGFTPLGSRGSGVKRLINVMGSLLLLNPEEGHSIILYDEPETSLHADAQHMLRQLLEGIAAHRNVQVVYTTHSPAMINTLRPQSIRVLERKRENDKAVSVFVNKAFDENYTLVRSSLGVVPSDSLLYAPITIVAEGATEIRCIPIMLKKLAKAGVIDTTLLDNLLSQSHLLDGQGDSFEYMVRLAKSQNASPLVFLDGDKLPELKKVREKHPEVPIVTLEEGKEFEQLVPRENYFQAVAEILEDESGAITETAFLDWEKNAGLRQSVMFSKRVKRWLRDEFDKSLCNHRVMQRAIELTETDSIEAKPFKELVEAMCKVSGAL